jgi:hypothetical protein
LGQQTGAPNPEVQHPASINGLPDYLRLKYGFDVSKKVRAGLTYRFPFTSLFRQKDVPTVCNVTVENRRPLL